MKKTRIVVLLLIFSLLLCGCSKFTFAPKATAEPTPAPTPTPTATPEPTPSPEPTPTPKPVSPAVQALLPENEKVWDERQDQEWLVGRLLIPSADIDVPLYEWCDDPVAENEPSKVIEVVRQLVVDHENSALIYNDELGNIIADHSNQDFATLSAIKLGDPAYILKGESVLSLECDLVSEGTNTGNGIVDAEGNWFSANEDYFCYTCLENWTHVLVVGFRVADEDFFTPGMKLEASGSGEAELAPVVITLPPAQPTPTSEPTPSPTPSPTPAPTPKPTPAPPSGPVVTYNPAWDLPPVSDDIYSDNYQWQPARTSEE